MNEDASVVVAGAGLAGLVAARRLARAGADVTVFERRSAVGGRVRTRRVDGFTLDRGFQVLFTAYPAVQSELDLDSLDLRAFTPGAVIARPGERSTLSDPLRDPWSLTETLFNREVTTSDKLRTLALRQDLSGRSESAIFSGPDDTIRAYLRDWGFSEQYVEHFVAPFYGGITLDRSLSTSSRVFQYTFKVLSEGRIAVPAAGMGAIPDQLASRAETNGATIHLDEPVESVTDRDDGVTVETSERTVDADAVVVATDPERARTLTGVESIPTATRSSVTQYHRLPGGVPLDAGKKILLNAAGPDPNAVVPLSAVAPEYAPGDATLLAATYLGAAHLDRPEAELYEQTRRTLESWYPERAFDALDTIATDRIEFAQYAQPPGVHDGLPGPRDAGGRTYLAGDYTTWSSIQGAMRSGQEAAAAVRTDLPG
jgi:phytoene dehydrogenase-like protein